MARTLDPQLRRALAERVRYCHEMGIYDFYQRESEPSQKQCLKLNPIWLPNPSLVRCPELREEMPLRKSAVVPIIAENVFEVISPKPESGVADPLAALKLIREISAIAPAANFISRAASRSFSASAIRARS
jgi:hypothetical protein